LIARPPFPARFRRRITITYVVVAGLSAGALALGAALAVYSYRTSTFVERAREQVRDDVRLLAAGAPPNVVAGRLADAEQPGGPAVIVVTGGETISSVETLDLGDVPAQLRRDASSSPGTLVEDRTELLSGATLVIGTVDPDSEAEAFFLFPREELERSLRELNVTLAIGWLIVVAVAAVAGSVIARRTLRPVRSAADAARSVAEGLLDTRLPVRSDDEFGEWAASFNEMVGALEQKILALADASDREKRFAADVAHDLRTPITAVLTAASHLASEGVRSLDEAHELGEIMLGAARRLDRLTAELLELHRLEAGHEVLNVEPTDLCDAVRHAVASHGWSGQVDLDAAEPVVVETDRRRLDRILVNLIGNGLVHGGTRVQVSVTRGVSGAWIAVSDNGPGIASTDLERIFERHYKADRQRGGGGTGSGLGLSIALETAQLLGGGLDATSADLTGATFTVWLPERSPRSRSGSDDDSQGR
jgi:two-component system sensor histidine kinase MtrB